MPQPPVQSLDLCHDYRLRRHPRRTVSRQSVGDLLQVLEPHGDMEPVEHRRPGDVGIGENAPEPRTTVAEGGQCRALGSPDGIQAPADQSFEVRISFGDRGENLPSTSLRFNIANPHLQVAFAVPAAADKGRI
jgi:hypothetical protein